MVIIFISCIIIYFFFVSGVLINKKKASPVEQESMRKYFDCMKFKLGDVSVMNLISKIFLYFEVKY